jgi:hypothetical protein
MMGAQHPHGRRRLSSILLGVGLLGAILATQVDLDLSTGDVASVPPSASSGPCGSASAATTASVDNFVARRIYRGELGGKEVRADIAHVTRSRELLTALAGSAQTAVYTAVHTIVYTPRWHIVRLRVSAHGRVLADVGGPDIIAPISGTLRFRGRAVGHFVMSVQDDLGYIKLVSRFIGIPIDLYRNGSLVMGTLRPAPSSVTDGAMVTIAGRAYRTLVLDALAFPSGTLRAVLFVPVPSGPLRRRGCAEVRLAAWGSVLRHIATRFSPLSANYRSLAGTVRGASGGFVFVRAGSKRLAGTLGPSKIPRSGSVSYDGRKWRVYSWEPRPPARIYFLTPTG